MLTVVVFDPVKMNALFAGIWSGANNALIAGNIAGANKYLNVGAQRKYRRVFQVLLPRMAEIVASYSPLREVSISEQIGEYAVNRTYQGQNRLYLIYFLKDNDGVWRLDGM